MNQHPAQLSGNHRRGNVAARNRRMGLVVAGIAVGMLGLAYASVPLLTLSCAKIGCGGTPKVEVAAPVNKGESGGQIISVSLDANVMPSLDWTFRADIGTIKVNIGEVNRAKFHVKNNSQKTITGLAVFNITPYQAAPYVSKIDCFCFSEQRLEAGEEIPLVTSFFIDPAISDNPNSNYLKNIVLSYTFYQTLDSEKESETAMLGDPINVE